MRNKYCEENERLKMQLRIISDEMRDNGFLFAEKSKKIEDLQLENEYLKRKFNQTLQEIKEIVNNKVNLEFDITKKLKEIKDIISEVEE